jgi:hypothetical protein
MECFKNWGKFYSDNCGVRHIQLLEKYKQNFDEGRPFIGKIASWIDYTAAVTAVWGHCYK